MRLLFLITARAGSKGLPGKNIKQLNGKPLVTYSIEYALSVKGKDDVICISTDDEEVIKIAEKAGIRVPFKRPHSLATDSSTTHDVILHAIEYYEAKSEYFDAVLLLQPTSPIRESSDFDRLKLACDEFCDMVVTVKQAKENPYFTLFEENDEGYLIKSKEATYSSRQECPQVFSFNGSMYLIKVASLKKRNLNNIGKIKKVIIPPERSVDIDTILDWVLAEYLIMNKENEGNKSST